jgi:tetratricopeptide (TPR) repeat protein
MGGKFVEARSGFEREAALSGELGLRIKFASNTLFLTFCELNLGRYEQAHTLAQANLARCGEAGYRLWTGWALMLAGIVALARGEPAEARRQLADGVRVLRSAAKGMALAVTLAAWGYADRALGRPLEAEQHLCEAVQMALEGVTPWFTLMYALPGAALLLADRGSVERAIEVYSLALCHPYVANSQWFEDVASKHIVAAAATLPPDVVAAAQERGRAQDLWATAEELLSEFRADL